MIIIKKRYVCDLLFHFILLLLDEGMFCIFFKEIMPSVIRWGWTSRSRVFSSQIESYDVTMKTLFVQLLSCILFFNLSQMLYEDKDFHDNLQHAPSFWWKLIVSTSYIKSKFFSPSGVRLVIFIQFMNWYWSGFLMVSWVLVWSKIVKLMGFFLFCIHLMDENFWSLVFDHFAGVV